MWAWTLLMLYTSICWLLEALGEPCLPMGCGHPVRAQIRKLESSPDMAMLKNVGKYLWDIFWSLYTALLAITWILYLSWNLLMFPPICCKEVIRTITEMWGKKQHSVASIASTAISKQLKPRRTKVWHFSGPCINRVHLRLFLRFSALL